MWVFTVQQKIILMWKRHQLSHLGCKHYRKQVIVLNTEGEKVGLKTSFGKAYVAYVDISQSEMMTVNGKERRKGLQM